MTLNYMMQQQQALLGSSSFSYNSGSKVAEEGRREIVFFLAGKNTVTTQPNTSTANVFFLARKNTVTMQPNTSTANGR